MASSPAGSQDFISRVIGAASQGAVGAVVAAFLSAGTEPVVNRVLVKRIPLITAIKEVDAAQFWKMLQTTMPTNFIKFPFFEAVNVIMQGVAVPPALRGSVTGAVFCTITLPITNYRFRKSMNMSCGAGDLYQAYLPTVFRDIIYGVIRNKVGQALFQRDPVWAQTNAGRFCTMFLTVLASTVCSAPGNELRAYVLQPQPRMPFAEFFKPEKFVRSTTVGSLIMAISLGAGALATPQAQKFWDMIRTYLKDNPLAYTMLVLFAFHTYTARRQNQELKKAIADGNAGSK